MAAGIDELCVAQAHRQCALVHARDERDAEIVGDRAAGVVRGAHHHRCEQGTYAELLACLEADAAPGLARCRAAHGDHVVQVPRLEGDQCAHHLGEARRRHAQLLVAGPDDDAVALYEIRISDARKTILGRVQGARGEEDCDGDYLPNRPLSLPRPCCTPVLTVSLAALTRPLGDVRSRSSSMAIPMFQHIANCFLSPLYMLV